MPPRVRLSDEEALRLPDLLARVEDARAQFPRRADPPQQAAWIRERYRGQDEMPPTTPLIALLLFEHGVHRSVDQVAADLAMLCRSADASEPR